jgi:hypothetical protein
MERFAGRLEGTRRDDAETSNLPIVNLDGGCQSRTERRFDDMHCSNEPGVLAQRRHDLETYRQVVGRQSARDRSRWLSGLVERARETKEIFITRRQWLPDAPRDARCESQTPDQNGEQS